MTDPSKHEAPDPAATLAAIRKKSDLIHRLRTKRDAGESKSMGAALALQKSERERRELQAKLPPLRLVSSR